MAFTQLIPGICCPPVVSGRRDLTLKMLKYLLSEPCCHLTVTAYFPLELNTASPRNPFLWERSQTSYSTQASWCNSSHQAFVSLNPPPGVLIPFTVSGTVCSPSALGTVCEVVDPLMLPKLNEHIHSGEHTIVTNRILVLFVCLQIKMTGVRILLLITCHTELFLSD